jgi:hypothetical protein
MGVDMDVFRYYKGLLGVVMGLWVMSGVLFGQALRHDLDDTGGFVHLTPGTIRTTNGCADFSVSVVLTVTDARVFGLRFYFDQANLELVGVTPGTHASLHLMPDSLDSDTLYLDGFFDPNFPAGSVTVATLHLRAISPSDATALIGFLDGQGFSGDAGGAQPISFSGDTTTVLVEGTAPQRPGNVIIVTLPYPHHADSVRIQWNPVYQDLTGDSVRHPLYSVYCWDVKNDTTFFVTETLDTFIYHDYVKETFFPGDPGTVNAAIYWVTACKTQP